MDFCWLGAGGGGTKEKGKNGKIPFLSPLVLLFPFPLVFFPSSVEWLEKFDCLSIHKSTINGEKRRIEASNWCNFNFQKRNENCFSVNRKSLPECVLMSRKQLLEICRH